ncbi:MAG: fibronectin type III domain-containing protein [Verrucomicrobiia bacterium]|jgi:hypothetical protein
MKVTKCGVMVGLFVWGMLAMPAAHAQTVLEVIPSVTNICLTLDGFNSSSGQPVGQVTAGWGCTYQASGCITINVGCGSSCNSADPNGNEYSTNICVGSSTNTTAGEGFACSGLIAYSLVGEVNGECIQLGTSGSFTSPATGLLSVYVNDDDYFDDGGSFNVCIQMPDAGLVSSGGPGGPFTPPSCAYTLTNSGAASLAWSATNGQNWVSLSSTGGTLAAAASTTVTISINSNADALVAGVYTDSVSFANLTSGNGSTARPVSLAVIALPAAPSGLTATAAIGAYGLQINLGWAESSTNQDGFTIERAPDVGGVPGTWAQIAVQVGGDYRGYSDVNLPMGTTYWYRIRAYNGGGYSPYSNLASAETFYLPPAPTSLIATSTPYGDITLFWVNVATNASENIIWRALDNGGVPGTWTLDGYAATNTTNLVVSGLASGTIYWFTVQAYNDIGYSPYSNFASAITAGPPPTPSNLVAVVVASNQVNLSWAEVAGSVTGFQISRGAEGTLIANINSNTTIYSDFGVTTNKTYTYWVRSYNSYGDSAFSFPASVTVPALPPAPSNLIATGVATNQINLSWKDNSSGQAGFALQRALDNVGSPGTWAQIATPSNTVTTYSDTGLAPTTRYWYRVSATNVSGDSPFSNLANATTASGTNVWINPLSDKWEIAPNWSQGVPSSAQSGLLITNANTTTVTIDAVTAASNAVNQCLTIGNLTIFSPAGATNTLNLTSAGPTNPLHVINSLTVTNGGAINITNSVLQVDGTFALDGSMTLPPTGQLIGTNASMYIGVVSTGQVTMTGGSAALRTLIVASNAYSSGTFTMTGGNVSYSNVWFGVGSNSSASVWLTGGSLTSTNRVLSSIVGRFGNAQMTISNGATLTGWTTWLGDGSAATGTLTVAGGYANLGALTIAAASNSAGAAWMSGGQLVATNQALSVGFGEYSAAQMTISNGTVLVGSQSGGNALIVAGNNYSTGTLTMYGGTLLSSPYAGGPWFVGGGPGAQGYVWINNGTIQAVDNNSTLFLGEDSGLGQWVLTNGFVTFNNVYDGLINGLGTLTIDGGTFSIISNTIVSLGGTGAVWVTGGQLFEPTGTFVLGEGGPGLMNISGGSTVIGSMIVPWNNATNTGILDISGGRVTVFDSLVVGDCASNAIGQITINGGTLYVTNATHTGYLDLRDGTLTVSGTGHLVADVFVMTNTCGLFVNDGGSVSFGTTIFNTNLSTVGDGIPDAWRAEYFPGVDPTGRTTNNLSCATCDPDGDGQNNMQEYLAGTNPTNAASLLRIVSLAQVAGNVQVSFTSVSGKYYTLERCQSLGGAWTTLVDNIPGTGSIRQATDVGGASQSVAFYRIQLNQSPNLVLVDSIGDGIPDAWRAQYFPNVDPTGATTNNLSCTLCDSDGTGFNNLQDYLVGVDPTNPAAALRITSIVPTGNSLLVTWAMGPNRTNALQVTVGDGFGDYSTEGFSDIFTVTNTVGTTTNYLDTGAATNLPARYYRVRLVP